MQALIHISGTQILEEQEPDTIELTTCGTFLPTEGGYALSYTEGQGEDSTEVTLHIAGNRVTLERTGSRSSILILEKQRRHHSQYSTPYGVLDMGTYATALDWELTELGGTLDFAYTLGFNGSVNSSHTVHITVQEENTSCPIS